MRQDPLNPRLLIDAIVRQTTVLVARLSTVEGARSPLGRERSGRQDGTRHDSRYRTATAEELRDLESFAETPHQDPNAALVWVQIYRDGPLTLCRERAKNEDGRATLRDSSSLPQSSPMRVPDCC